MPEQLQQTARAAALPLESMSRDELQALQFTRLLQVLRVAGESSDFYRRKWQAAGMDVNQIHSWETFQQLPLTEKRELVEDQAEHPPYGTNLTYPLERYVRVHQTSGTTGKPLYWLDTAESWEWWLHCWSFVYRAAGIGPGDRILVAFSFGPFIGFWAAFEAASRMGARVIAGGGQDSLQRLQQIRAQRANVLVSTPSYALRLAEVAREHGWDPSTLGIEKTVHAGEPGASIPATKRRIEQAWGACTFDHYGMTEMGAVSYPCPAEPFSMHVNESEFIAEVLDPLIHRPAAEGEEGELVLTNLGRLGSPLIRYRTGDRVRLVREPCPCGRTFARLVGGVLGRVDDMIVVRGVNVFPSALENVVRGFPEIDEFLIEVSQEREMAAIRLLLEINEHQHGPARRQAIVGEVIQQVRQIIGIRIDAEAVPSGTLPRHELKARRVVRRAG